MQFSTETTVYERPLFHQKVMPAPKRWSITFCFYHMAIPLGLHKSEQKSRRGELMVAITWMGLCIVLWDDPINGRSHSAEGLQRTTL